jgi:hypothetical protein
MLDSRDIPSLSELNQSQLFGDPEKGYFEFDGQVRMLNAKPRQRPYGTVEAFRTLGETAPLIPRDEWKTRVAEKDANGTWLFNILKDIPAKDQNGLGYCHAYGPVAALERMRVLQGLPYVELSAESIGGPVTNWRNEGAMPEDDVEQLIRIGCCRADMMDKPHSLNPNRWNENWEADCANHKLLEAWDADVPGKAFDGHATLTLSDCLDAIGFDQLSHEIHGGYQLRYNAKSGLWEILNQNNWGPNWPEPGLNGFIWMPEGTRGGWKGGTPSIGIFGVRYPTHSEN